MTTDNPHYIAITGTLSDKERAAFQLGWEAAMQHSQAALMPADNWRPIETVPQDGTPVLIWLPDVDRGLPGAEVAQCLDLGVNDELVFWTNGGPNAGDDMDEWSTATHWMPLPPAPRQKEGA